MKIFLSPKHDFLSDKPRASSHQDTVASPAFKAAASAALLEYQYRLPAVSLADASVAQFKLKGAQEFLAILLNLGEPEKPGVTHSHEALNPV